MNRKTAIITGASSGIGKALAYEFAKNGYDISICARRIDKLKAISEDISSKFDSEVLISKVDVSVEADCQRFIEE